MSVADRLAHILQRIDAACRRVDRDPASVTLVGASKRQPHERLREAWEAGLRVFGENLVQEAEAHREIVPEAEWHLIGPLQSNKVKRALDCVTTVQSVDRLKIAHRLDREASSRDAFRDNGLTCFLEVNLGNEDTKSGFPLDGFLDTVAPIAELEHLNVVGLMAIPPFHSDPEASRPSFQRLARLADEMAAQPRWSQFRGLLSMGMSGDFEVAIEEGATHVRVGTALFGVRQS